MALAPAPGEVPEEEKREERPIIDLWSPLRAFAEWLLSGFERFKQWIADGIKTFWDKVIPLKEQLPRDIYSSLTTTSPEWATPLTNELVHYYINYVKSYIKSIIESSPYVDRRVDDEVVAKLASILIPSATTTVVLSIAAQLAELLHPLRELRIGETIRDIEKAMGLSEVIASVYRVLYSETIIQPLKYDLNSIVRPFLPPPNVVDTMLFQEGIDERKWEEFYRKIGWGDEWIVAWRKARYRPPSPFLLYRLMENPNIPQEWYDKVLRYHALDEEDRSILIEAFKWYSLKDEIYRYRDSLVSYYRKGVLSKTRLLEEMNNLPLSKDVVDWTVKLADFSREMELREDLINSIREGFRKGKITELEYVNQLKDLNVDEPVIYSWLALDKVKRRVELRKTVVSLEEVG